MATDTLTVSEVFGPTVQGEGPTAGRRCAFVRLGRCNLDCHWCDTPYTWDWRGKNGTAYEPSAELSEWPVEKIVSEIERMKVPMLVISGGEPLLQRAGLQALCAAAIEHVDIIEIETNGTRPPLNRDLAGWVRYNVSPKLPSSGVAEFMAWVPDAVHAFLQEDATFKFVIADVDDLEAAAEFVHRFDVPDDRVWLMPEGRTADAVTLGFRDVVEAAVARNWNATTRLQVLAFGNERAH